MKLRKNFSFYIVLFIMFAILLTVLSITSSGAELSYSDFLVLLNNGQVKQVVLKNGKAEIELKDPFEEKLYYYLHYDSVESMENLLAEYKQKEIERGITDGLKYRVERTSTFTIFIIQAIPYILLAGVIIFWIYVMNQAQNTSNKAMSFGKSRARLSTESRNKVTFRDVAGAKEEKQELEELVQFLKDPAKYSALGARIPKGVLLVGPPGTGKTLLAKAVAGEAGVPFFTISGSDFVEMYVGVGASRVRDLFNQAKKNAPCIVFIDEIDAVGRHRGAGLGGGHDEREQTLNQLLVEMDGFQTNEGVIIMAATNRPDILDPALLRPGRFDRQIYVNLPDIREREEILKVHSRNKPLNDDVNLSDIAKTTPGFSGAELENLLNEAALIAARKNKKRIDMEDVKEATFKVIMGPEKKSKVMTERDKRLTAYHEVGHALAVKYVSTTDKVDRISIIPAGRAGGYTSFRPDEDLTYTTRSQLLERIIIALAGRAAEDIIYGDFSTGATSDLISANKIARNMVTRLGMSSKLGNVVLGGESDEVFIGKEMVHTKSYSEEFSAQVDREVKAIIDECYQKAKDVLTEHMDALHAVSAALLEKERLEGDEFEAILQDLYNKKQGTEIKPLPETTDTAGEQQEEKSQETADESQQGNEDNQQQNEN